MQLSSRILTALAVLILAVAVVAVRGGSSGTVEAATGTIDVLNVGTCYTTSTDVFGVGDCDAGDDEDYNVAGRDSITETGTVFATYAHDPKTAPDSPRAVLVNSNLLKISITDSGRDKRTPVLLGVAGNLPCMFNAEPTPTVTEPDPATPNDPADDLKTYNDRGACVTGEGTAAGALSAIGSAYYETHLPKIQEDYSGIAADANDFRWVTRGVTDTATPFTLTGGDTTGLNADKVLTGITIIKNAIDAEYKPMLDAGDDSPITLYGNYDADGAGAGAAVFQKLNKYLAIDEDVGSGRVPNESGNNEQEVAPWFSVRVEIPDAATVTVMYIVYETSEFESLAGGAAEMGTTDATTDAVTRVGFGVGVHEEINAPRFTDAERRSPDTKLVVEARSDGRASSQNLVLRETSRFSGQYEGYLKLTDENGNNGGTSGILNWGMKVQPGMPCTNRLGCTDMEAAVLGVESGPVVIAYRDTDGATQLLDVAIDTVPPTVQVDQPAHEVQIQDLSPEFAGSFSDGGSGLRDDSFRLYVDHKDDGMESGVSGDPVLDLRVDGMVGNNPYGLVTIAGTKAMVESHSDYAGFATTDPGSVFGVIPHGDVFNLDDEGNDSQGNPINEVEAIEGDPHDDGAINGTFGESVRIDFLDDEYNNTIDFQALVADVAGNIGFSDSDAAGPRFINNLGEETGKRKTERYNVLGWYARHIFFLDEVDPEIFQEQSVTGFYGENDDGEPQVNRSGILIAFDRAIDADSVGLDTFTVTLDPTGGAGSTGQAAQITDVNPQGRAVYLLLSEELASDATPSVDIGSGKWVSDPAGNRLTGGDQAAFDVKDGITPKITVALSGGSGSGEGDEGPSKLTDESGIIVTIASDEEINSTPSLAVVCSNVGWDSDLSDTDTELDKGLSDLVNSRSGGLTESSADFTTQIKDASGMTADLAMYNCGSGAGSYTFSLQQVQSYSRPGLSWEYQWVNFDDEKALQDGNLTVVAYARDRQSYTSLDAVAPVRSIDDSPTPANTYNWGAGTAEFRYDTVLADPDPTPIKDAVVTEVRPFVMLRYNDKSTVSIDEFKIDDTVQEAQALGENRFLYWPDELGLGSHTIAVKATDAAGNEDTFEYSFKTAERAAFGLKLIAGWNAVSFPANPIDPMIEDVFTDAAIDMIAGWDASDPEKPWSIATRMGDEWSTHAEHATLSRIHAQYGYWVHSQGFTTQRVQLIGGISRTDPNVVPADLVEIPTLPGWNFVGVIDQDGDQTQDDFGEVLMNRDEDGTQTPVTAGDYLGANKRAYTWDPIRGKFDIVEADQELVIGDGIWVYFGGGIAP